MLAVGLGVTTSGLCPRCGAVRVHGLGGARVASMEVSASSAAGTDPLPPAYPGARPVIYLGGSDKVAQPSTFFSKVDKFDADLAWKQGPSSSCCEPQCRSDVIARLV